MTKPDEKSTTKEQLEKVKREIEAVIKAETLMLALVERLLANVNGERTQQ